MRHTLENEVVNYSHQAHEDHERRVEEIRKVSASLNIEVGIICDLQGPKIRIGCFMDESITLRNEDVFTLDADCAEADGNGQRVGLSYPQLIDILLLMMLFCLIMAACGCR